MSYSHSSFEISLHSDWRRVPVAMIASLSLAISGCSAFDDSELRPSMGPVSTVFHPESPSPTMSTASHAPSPSTDTSEMPTPEHSNTPLTPPTPSSRPSPETSEPTPPSPSKKPTTTKQTLKEMQRCGNDSDKILLTFDDGTDKKRIMEIAAILEKEGVGAIFFPNNSRVSQQTVDELRMKGFWVGNHTKDHPNLVSLNEKKIKKAIQSGFETTLFRPPFGGYNSKGRFDDRIREVAASLGMRTCLWTIDTNDWQYAAEGTTKRISAQTIQNTVFKNLHKGGAVVLMHMAYNAPEALPGMIKGIRKRGYELCELPAEPTTSEIPESLPC